jgi:hypothetical protein
MEFERISSVAIHFRHNQHWNKLGSSRNHRGARVECWCWSERVGNEDGTIPMSDRRITFRYTLSAIVIAVAAWTIFNVSTGMRLYDLDSGETSRIAGCYYVGDVKLFQLRGNDLIVGSQSFNAVGHHEKNGDFLLVQNPLEIHYQGTRPILIVSGHASKIRIIYSNPIQMTIFDVNGMEVSARKAKC